MQKIPTYKLGLAGFDYIIILFAFIVSNLLYSIYLGVDNFSLLQPFDFIWLYAICALPFVFIFQYHNLYKINVVMSGSPQINAILKSFVIGVVFMITLSFIFRFSEIFSSRIYLLIFSACTLLFFILGRIVLFRWVYRIFAKNKVIKKPLLIIGAGKAGQLLATRLTLERELGLEVIGFLDDQKPVGREIIYNLKVLGVVSDIGPVIENYKVNEVIIAIDNIEYHRLLELIDLCNSWGLIVKTSSELFGIINQKFNIEKYSGIPIVEASPLSNNMVFRSFKRILDIIGTLFGIVLLSPFILLFVALIKKSSKGPILYTQTRIGKNGVPFKFYKFRSMTVLDVEDEDRKKMMIDFMKNGKKQTNSDSKIVNTSRVTPIGQFLRKTSLDELPQLLNVLKGEMSLVGPRPCLPYEYENYDEWQKRRVAVTPGCTGLWQVSGRSEVSFVDSIILDLYYINRMSPWLDLQIILMTIPVMLFAKGGK